MKVSSTFRSYPDEIVTGTNGTNISLSERAKDLYGKNIFQTFLKDYNAQTIWLSVNIKSFLKEDNRFPKWLNIATGYGAENMYGGFRNEWDEDDPAEHFEIAHNLYPRYRQVYLAPDIDLSKIKVKSRFLQTLLSMANIFKIPSPAIEFNLGRSVKWKWIYY